MQDSCMIFIAKFPTRLHQDAAELIRDYFLAIPAVDTVLVVNSCARGWLTPESDLDFAILTKPGTTPGEILGIENSWHTYSKTQPTFLEYRQSSQD